MSEPEMITPADIDETGLNEAGAKKIVNRAHRAAPGSVFCNGRRAALMAIDSLMGRTPNIQKLYNALQERMDVDPVGLLREIVIPLTPRSVIDGEGTVDPGAKRTVIAMPANGREAPPVLPSPEVQQ